MENVEARRGEESPKVIAPVRKYPSLSRLDLDTFAGCDEALNFNAVTVGPDVQPY